MKTMKKEQEIKRVPEPQVDFYLEAGWEFCSKSEWKEEREKELGVSQSGQTS